MILIEMVWKLQPKKFSLICMNRNLYAEYTMRTINFAELVCVCALSIESESVCENVLLHHHHHHHNKSMMPCRRIIKIYSCCYVCSNISICDEKAHFACWNIWTRPQAISIISINRKKTSESFCHFPFLSNLMHSIR